MLLTLVQGVSTLKVMGFAHPALIYIYIYVYTYLSTVPRRFLQKILTLRLGNATLRLNARSTKILKCDSFLQLYETLDNIECAYVNVEERFGRESFRLLSVLGNMALVALLEEQEIRNLCVRVYTIYIFYIHVVSGKV